ncbi:phosphoenolpyruvate carboxylase, partial [Crocosphaera sp.]
MLLESLQSTVEEVNIFSTSDLFLRQRLELVESLWESVLKAECGLELVDLLKKLRKISSPEGQVTDQPKTSINELIEELELNEAIRATRAFALYFQLINIVEQHYEQRDQQLNRRSTYQESEKARENYQKGEKSTNGLVGADLLEKALVGETKSQEKGGTFHWLFPQLKRLNVPPQQIQRLLEQLDIRLVFTAHPTEIVRHTIRLKQRRIATLLR